MIYYRRISLPRPEKDKERGDFGLIVHRANKVRYEYSAFFALILRNDDSEKVVQEIQRLAKKLKENNIEPSDVNIGMKAFIDGQLVLEQSVMFCYVKRVKGKITEGAEKVIAALTTAGLGGSNDFGEIRYPPAGVREVKITATTAQLIALARESEDPPPEEAPQAPQVHEASLVPAAQARRTPNIVVMLGMALGIDLNRLWAQLAPVE